MAFLSRAMQGLAAQAFPQGTGGMTALPGSGAMARLLSSGLGSSVSSPPSTAPGASIRQTPEINPASLQPGTGGALGQLARLLQEGTLDTPTEGRMTGTAGMPDTIGRAAGMLNGGIGEMPQGVQGVRAPVPLRPRVMALTGL